MTIDHVNPEAPWPDRERLEAATRSRGLELAPRLPVYPRYLSGRVGRSGRAAARRCARRTALGLAREDGWHPGEAGAVPFLVAPRRPAGRHERRAGRGGARPALPRPRRRAPARLRRGRPAPPRGVRRRGQLRRHAEHPVHERLLLPLRLLRVLEGQARGEPARRAVPRPARRDRPARARGVGPRRDRGLPPGRDPPGVHGRVLRVGRGRDPGPSCPTSTSTRSRRSRSGRARRRSGSRSSEYLELLRSLGLGSLPGTAAEILDDEVRAVICPDKVSTEQWLAVHDAAHRVGLRSNVTIMFGHVERPRALGAAPAAGARAAAAVGRVHRVRAAAVRAHGGADLASGPRPLGADVRRDAPHARGRAARAASGDHEHPGVVGEARARRRRRRRCGRASTTSAGR